MADTTVQRAHARQPNPAARQVWTDTGVPMRWRRLVVWSIDKAFGRVFCAVWCTYDTGRHHPQHHPHSNQETAAVCLHAAALRDSGSYECLGVLCHNCGGAGGLTDLVCGDCKGRGYTPLEVPRG